MHLEAKGYAGRPVNDKTDARRQQKQTASCNQYGLDRT